MKAWLNYFSNGLSGTVSITSAGFLLIFSLMAFQSLAVNSNITDHTEVSVIKRALPIYPRYAVKNGIEGTVLINFSIEKDGNVSDIQVAASDQDGLFDATAILGIQKWVYTKSAQKVRNNYVAIEFALTDKPATSQFSNVEKIQVRGE